MTIPTIEEANELLADLQPGDRLSLLDPKAINHRGLWCAYYVVAAAAVNVPSYRRCLHGPEHVKVSVQVWEHTGFVDEIAACHLTDPSTYARKSVRVWQMPEDAKHTVSQTCFENRETGQSWISTTCGVLLETTGDRKWWKDGHLGYPAYGMHSDRITCPGCQLRNGLEI
ncbi:hypothetical protein ABZ543_13315 [Streptomyces roseifaciens]